MSTETTIQYFPSILEETQKNIIRYFSDHHTRFFLKYMKDFHGQKKKCMFTVTKPTVNTTFSVANLAAKINA